LNTTGLADVEDILVTNCNVAVAVWWLDNISKDLGEVGWGDVDWIGLAQDRKRWRAVVNSVLNLRVP
jgi:hypothetical protein